jgi:succinyl-CoA synthetase alpha subunit
VADAVAATGATASCIFIPAPGVKAAVMEAAEGGIEFIVVHHRGCARAGRGLVLQQAEARLPGRALLGPNCPGIISPGKANIGITAGHIAKPAVAGEKNVGIVSRSGTLTYQALYELQQQGIGVTTCVGIGGDPVPGTSFIDCLEAFEADPETHAVMMIGEIGGSAEEEAAEFIKSEHDQAGVELHRRRHRSGRQEDGPRRRHRVGRQGHGAAAKMEALRPPA